MILDQVLGNKLTLKTEPQQFAILGPLAEIIAQRLAPLRI